MDDESGSNEGVTPTPRQRHVIESDAPSLSVDAGAGTGKTTTMVYRLEQAITERGVDPSAVLVVTFANEAAANIRRAIGARLGPDVAPDVDVFTYHSLCYHLVSEYAYYLGLSPSFDVVTERERRRRCASLLREREYPFVATDVPDDEPATPTTLAGPVDRFIATMSRENIDPETLEAALPDERTLGLLEDLLGLLREKADADLSFENEALRYFSQPSHLQDAESALVEYGTRLTYCREKIAEAPSAFRDHPVVSDIDQYVRTLQGCVTRVRSRLSLDDPRTKHLPRVLFCDQLYRQQTATIEQTPIGRLEQYVKFLREARSYTAVYADYRRSLEQAGALDFDMLVGLATELVEDDAVAEEIVGRWEQVYCDEFQDTDQMQTRLVRALTGGEDRPSLVAIGDVDQSIYGWRGTDPTGLQTLGQQHDGHESISLEENFRSPQEILDLTNLCQYGEYESKTLQEYRRDEPADETKRVLKIESEELSQTPAEQAGNVTAQLINGAVDDVPERSLADIAIIVRTNAQADAVGEALRERQIPFERPGARSGSISTGIQTVLSYLRVLVTPAADAHLRRVLLLRYRVPSSDVQKLATRDERLLDRLQSAPWEHPGASYTEEGAQALEAARRDIERLRTDAKALPLVTFFHQFRTRTRLEWFVDAADRQAFDRIERFADSYAGDDVLESLSPAFIDALERAMGTAAGGHRQGTTSSDAVDVMTVHQAKGLEFDTVLVPYLSEEEWCVRSNYAYSSRYRMVSALLDPEIESPLCADLAAEPAAESWRVLHVALTRAENHLFVFGSPYDYDGEEDALGTSLVDACLASPIQWSAAGERMDLWRQLQAAFEVLQERYPNTVCEYTQALEGSAQELSGNLTYSGPNGVLTLDSNAAIDVTNRLGRQLRTGILLEAADAAPMIESVEVPRERRCAALIPETSSLSCDGVRAITADPRTPPAMVHHSYSALESHETCPRKHYLEYVVSAFDDPVSGSEVLESEVEPVDGPDPGVAAPRLVGTVFHAVAEEAYYREITDSDSWKRIASRRLRARNRAGAIDVLERCIDRYFEATADGIGPPVHAWDQWGVEVPFSLAAIEDMDGRVVGSIDSLRRAPDGRLVVLDYKATSRRRDPTQSTQLALYGHALERQFGVSVDAVGYMFVGDVDGPRVDLCSLEDAPSWGAVRSALTDLERDVFAETRPGDHCRSCPHRSLGCGPEI